MLCACTDISADIFPQFFIATVVSKRYIAEHGALMQYLQTGANKAKNWEQLISTDTETDSYGLWTVGRQI